MLVLVHFDLYKVPHKAPTDLERYIGVKDKKYGDKIFGRKRKPQQVYEKESERERDIVKNQKKIFRERAITWH